MDAFESIGIRAFRYTARGMAVTAYRSANVTVWAGPCRSGAGGGGRGGCSQLTASNTSTDSMLSLSMCRIVDETPSFGTRRWRWRRARSIDCVYHVETLSPLTCRIVDETLSFGTRRWRRRRARSIDHVYHVDGLNIESVDMSNSGQDPIVWDQEVVEEEGMVN